MIDDRLQEASYIRDLISQREQLANAFSEENIDNLWTDCADGLPEFIESDLDPTYLQILIGLDEMLKNEDSPEDSIMSIKEYITIKVDEKVDETISFLKKRIQTMNSNIDYLKKKFKKNWSMSYDEAFLNIETDSIENNLSMDDILDKINERGMSSLTKDEKKFLKSNSKDKNDGKDK